MSIKQKLQEIEKQYWMSGDTKMSEVFLELLGDLESEFGEVYESGITYGKGLGYEDGCNETRSEIKEELFEHLENNEVSDRVIKLVKEVL